MNEGLASGLDIFNDGPTHRAIGAGQEEQLWFFEAVLKTSEVHTDPRLVPMRARLRQELQRFKHLTDG